MPYSNVPDDLQDKMEKCVESVMEQGKDKEAAIRICYRSVVGKEMDEAKSETKENNTKCMGEQVIAVIPWNATSFAEIEEATAAHASAEEISDMAATFRMLTTNILNIPEVEDKPAALRALANEFADKVDTAMQAKATKEAQLEPVADKAGRRINAEKVGMLKGLAEKLREMMKSMSEFVGWADYDDGEPEDKAAKTGGGLMIWKEASGAYRWLAVYSNHFRDDDNPPEIIASKSHQRFVEKVDAGEFPYPELWHWHTPGTAWGKADWVGFDSDAGFALASGLVLPGHEKEAEAVAALGDTIALSHGMPKKSIARDPSDASVIVEHQTVEISDLLRPAAANKMTHFEVLKEENMAIPDEKKEYLRQVGLSDEKIASIEQGLEASSKKALEDGIEHKEAAKAEPEAPAAETPAEPETKSEAPDLAKALTDLTGIIETLQKTVSDQAAEIQALKARELELTPAASLNDLLRQSVIGQRAAQIQANSKLLKETPVETKAANTGLFFDEWLAPAAPGSPIIPGAPQN